ncbi:N-acetylmuramoyl-L-alanine amidase [Streptomyces sp. SP18ES09]|uniref:peptidoglycan recognition protein family protein n=1 Tax=Streptomyces sp. SP18ES09 TaxID=3002532 RepID=UPI002E772EDE|nr:N-acetylmuramoyl-L-alanine amidase [Streptomyces sp. SP18ES09]MEE1813710.1 N-acetylmuramoyl-L-alanine amidase [Streptomyces sp. SP18ES09]
MAWYPGATRYELQPESDAQPAIRPTQVIFHSIAAPWTAKRVYEYWRDSTNLESHFGLGYEGDLGQFIGTETRADANYQANRRPDGTGAISLESASNLEHTDPWTPAQIEELIKLGVWAHKTHGIPLRICRSWDDPGFGYHALYPEWAVSGTACPGAARIAQFKSVVFPGIVARATGKTDPTKEDPVMALSQQDVDRVALRVLEYRNPTADEASKKLGRRIPDFYGYVVQTFTAVTALTAKVDKLTALLNEKKEA